MLAISMIPSPHSRPRRGQGAVDEEEPFRLRRGERVSATAGGACVDGVDEIIANHQAKLADAIMIR